MLDESEVERILVVTAHPDDVDFGAGGTVASWTAAGKSVSYCIVTDGQAGGNDRDVPRSQMPVIRRAEQTAAGLALGVTDIRFLGYVDGELTVTHDLRRDISRVIRSVRPQRMLVQSPERNWARIFASHPDHLAAGEAALQAIYPDARNPFAHPSLLADEALEPWSVEEVWVMATGDVDHYVDVTDMIDRKITALQAHVSQTSHMDDLRGFVSTWLARNAAAAGWPEGRLAEAFKVISTV